MVCAITLRYTKEDIDEKLIHIKNFVPKIGNWSICDSFCNSLKITKHNQQKVFDFLLSYYFINNDYLYKLFNIFDSINNRDYYAEMVIAWAISMLYVNFFLINSRLVILHIIILYKRFANQEKAHSTLKIHLI